MPEFIPEGYEKFTRPLDKSLGEADSGESLRNTQTGEVFKLTNRSFKEINNKFSQLPSRAVETLLKTRPQDEQIKILDIGGGIESRAANQFSEKYDRHRSRIAFINLDLTARGRPRDNVHRAIGDTMQMPLTDGSIDIAYARQSLAIMAENSEEGEENFLQSLAETARVLKPGGIAFVDETQLSYLPTSDETLAELSKKLSVKFFARLSWKKSNKFLQLIDNIRNKHDDINFLIMVKEPMDPELSESLDLK